MSISEELCNTSAVAMPLWMPAPRVLLPGSLQPMPVNSPSEPALFGGASALPELLFVGTAAEVNASEESHPGCIARTVCRHVTPSGQVVVLLKGLSRGIGRPIKPKTVDDGSVAAVPYVVVEPILDEYSDVVSENVENTVSLREKLIAAALESHADPVVGEMIRHVLQAELPLGRLCDVIADTLATSEQDRREIFAEHQVARRCQLLLDALARRAVWNQIGYPTAFSEN